LFGDTTLAQFNPSSKSFLQPFVLIPLLPTRVLQVARVTDKGCIGWRAEVRRERTFRRLRSAKYHIVKAPKNEQMRTFDWKHVT
jgi:hypothetical protein